MLSDVAESALMAGEKAEKTPPQPALEPQPGEQHTQTDRHKSESLKLLRRLSAQPREFKVQPHVGGLSVALLGVLQKIAPNFL